MIRGKYKVYVSEAGSLILVDFCWQAFALCIGYDSVAFFQEL